MEKKLWIFFSFVLLSMTSEHSISPICQEGALLSLLHHILSIFMVLSPFMFKEYKLHIVLTMFIWFGWKMFDGKCVATMKYNEICKKSDEATFINIQSVLTNHTGFDWTYGIGIPILLFSMYKLYTQKDFF
jgi:hypothetical protein